jgi:hypothetical protein
MLPRLFPLISLFQDAVLQLTEELGRLFVLDMVLGNADRLPCADLGWRGNTGNLLLGAPGELLDFIAYQNVRRYITHTSRQFKSALRLRLNDLITV